MSRTADEAPTLAVRFPDLAAEWHPTRNGNLSPARVRVQSNRTVWWRCNLGHEWEARVYNRTLGGNSCPYCVGKRASATYNLRVLHPGVAAEWHPTRNGTLNAEAVIPKSNRRVWWRCPSGHEWEAPISKRCGGRGCPYCAGKYATPDRNLAVLYPALAEQWHPTRNGQRRPESILPASGLRAWWRCDQGHTWATRVYSRSQAGTGCPECADRSKKGIPLGEKAPELLDEWDLDFNGGPGDDVAAGSALRAWWHCRLDSSHRWRATVRHRVRGTGCPYCAGKLPTPGRNLGVVYPDIATEWHPDRNGDLSPTDVLPHSHITVWWHCSEGHAVVWQRATRAGHLSISPLWTRRASLYPSSPGASSEPVKRARSSSGTAIVVPVLVGMAVSFLPGTPVGRRGQEDTITAAGVSGVSPTCHG
jgi:hypothetical protein